MIIIDNLAEPKEELVFTKKRTDDWLSYHLQSTVLGVDGYKVSPERINDSRKRYQVCYLSNNNMNWHEDFVSIESMFFQGLRLAFNHHIDVTLDPDSIWYCIAHELAIHISLNQDRYRGYFTVSDKKEDLVVEVLARPEQEQWKMAIPLFMAPIRKAVPRATIDLLLPQFSTTTEIKNLAKFSLFMNILSNYYNFVMKIMCGIPRVRIEGTQEDWNRIVDHAVLASKEFDGLEMYFADLIPVLKEIAGVANGEEPDPDFWRSMYKYKATSWSSGLDGWITTLFAYEKHGNGSFELKPDFNWRHYWDKEKTSTATFFEMMMERRYNFPAGCIPNHMTTVPFKLIDDGKEIEMEVVSGFMGLNYDEFLSPQLGFAVLEKQFTE